MAKVTLKDIAQEVGVSPSTVSLVLNGRQVRVSDEKRRAILECARRKRYVPNQIARSLVTQRSNTLGLVVPNIESRFFSSLAKNLELRCRQAGFALLITNTDSDPANDPDLVQLLVNRGADGIFVVVTSELDAEPQLVDALAQLPVPYVMVDRFIEGLQADCVRFDSEAGGYLATSHLIAHGHRSIACVANRESNTGRERIAGYERALREAGIAVDPALELQSDYYLEDAYRMADGVVGLGVTAVVATSDNIALGLLRRFSELGRHVPNDISMVSYDNSSADFLFEPALTSIEQNVGELSEVALRMMLGRIGEQAQGREAADPCVELLQPKLVVKDSVAEV